MNAAGEPVHGDVLANLAFMAPEDPPARANPARGLALIATALILGIFVLRQGFDTTEDLAAGTADLGEEEAPPTDETADDDGDDGGDDNNGGDEPPPEPAAPSELTVRVANTTSVGGAAGGWSDRIKDNSYDMADPTDAADPERDRETTAVVFAPGLDAEAAVLAGAIGDPERIELREYTAEPELLDRNGEVLMGEGVDLVILLGTDLASQAGG